MRYALLMLVCVCAWAHAAEEPHNGATFKEGVGVHLDARTSVALDARTVEVEERAIAPTLRFTAHVDHDAQDDAARRAHASAWTTPARAAQLTPGAAVAVEEYANLTGVVLRVHRADTAQAGRVEVLFQLTDPEAQLSAGSFVHIAASGHVGDAAMIVPPSALLETAYGPFVYAANGGRYLRIAVRVGVRTPDAVEILDGLYPGDEVVTQPVETLYLIELRATKGGGHSH